MIFYTPQTILPPSARDILRYLIVWELYIVGVYFYEKTGFKQTRIISTEGWI